MIESIEFKNVSMSFPEKQNLFTEINASLPMNFNVAIQGQRGTGKSTLLKLICGLNLPHQGDVLINGNSISKMSFNEFLPYRLKIGYGFDYGGLLNNRSIYDNLILPLKYHKILNDQDAHNKVMTYLDIFNLTEVANERPPSISGGRRKEVCVARAFVMEPEMLILDDPTTGLSAENKRSLIKLLQSKQKNGTLKHLFFTSEDLGFVSELVEQVITLRQGELAYLDLDAQKAVGEL